MIRLTIDGRQVSVPEGSTILEAAEKLAIDIPTMCYRKGYEPPSSCMLCVVKVENSNGLVPACAALAQDGMTVETNCPEVLEARKTALGLLLSDHLGDCIGPCQVACPAGMNIPLMIRQITAGRLRDAIETVKTDIALPAVLGRICPAPCERTCRRAQIDQAVSIRLLKRYVADTDLKSNEPYLPAAAPKKNRQVAIVGAGPAGLAAAYYLLRQGFPCTMFDDNDRPGGMLNRIVEQGRLAPEVLDAEIALIAKLGLEFREQR